MNRRDVNVYVSVMNNYATDEWLVYCTDRWCYKWPIETVKKNIGLFW